MGSLTGDVTARHGFRLELTEFDEATITIGGEPIARLALVKRTGELAIRVERETLVRFSNSDSGVTIQCLKDPASPSQKDEEANDR